MVLPYPPSVNHMYAYGKGVRLTEEAKRFRYDAGWLAREQGARIFYSPLKVRLALYKPRNVGDIDNPIKATLDAMNHILWDDDRQIRELNITIDKDIDDPRVELTLEELEL